MKKLFVLSALILTIVLNSFAQDLKTAEAIEGTWDYTSEMAPYEYQSGKVIFFKEEGSYKAKIDIDGYIIPMENLKIEKSKISCTASIDYEIVTINLELKDGKLSGTAETYDEKIPVELKKVK